jgi:hypothetical protein
MRLRKLRNQFGLWLLGLPKDTPGVMLPGTITLPEAAGIKIEGFYFHVFDPKTIAFSSTIDGKTFKFIGGAK